MLILKAENITPAAYNEIKVRKERESVRKSLVAFLTEQLSELKAGQVRQINFDKDVHYYSVLKALKLFDAKIEYKINNEKSRVFSIAIKVK